jgi:pimeloyl-ACP methyl ester carboxylesterase
MPDLAVRDVVILLPGITGSVLARPNPRGGAPDEVWSPKASALWRAVTKGAIGDLELTPDAADDGIVATRLVPDVTLIPGFWKIDGYGKVARQIVETMGLKRGENFFEFPYDWRRDNRLAAARLENDALEWLRAWRDSSGARDARLVLVGHSMGGLVARYFLECLGGWQHTRSLITFGTPHRGSLNAVNFLVAGMRKGIGPLGFDVTPLLRSLPSVYQLLPLYPCVDTGDAELARVPDAARTGQLPNIDATRADAARAFHEEIEKSQAANAATDAYRQTGYRTFPVVGIDQPTLQSARVTSTGVEMLRTRANRDESGDGTVPRGSATPLELQDQHREIYAADRHGSLQNADDVLLNLQGILTRPAIELRDFRVGPPRTLTLDIEDMVVTPEPFTIRAKPSDGNPRLTAHLTNLTTGAEFQEPLGRAAEGWQAVELNLPAGTYRVQVTGGSGTRPVTDLFVVAAPA